MIKKEKSFGDLIIATVEEKHGKGSIVRGSMLRDKKIEKISTGIAALDILLLGGWALGRFNELSGPPSALKSTTAIKSAMEFQDKFKDGYVCFVDFEHTFDIVWLEYLGADPERTLIIYPVSGEEGGQAALRVIKMSKQKDIPLFVIVDSLASMVPEKEIEGDMDDSQFAAQPRLIGKFCRKCLIEMRMNYTQGKPLITILALNQIRIKMGVVFGNPEAPPGGKQKDHAMSVQVQMVGGKKIKKKIGDFKISMGMEVGFVVSKNKAQGADGASGHFKFYNRGFEDNPGGKFNNEEALINYALAMRWAKETSKGLEWMDGNVYERQGRKVPKKVLIKEMRKNTKLYRESYNQCIKLSKRQFYLKNEPGESEEDEVGITPKKKRLF